RTRRLDVHRGRAGARGGAERRPDRPGGAEVLRRDPPPAHRQAAQARAQRPGEQAAQHREAADQLGEDARPPPVLRTGAGIPVRLRAALPARHRRITDRHELAPTATLPRRVHGGASVRSPSMDWLERVAKLRQWSRSGARAPHKPLLLLYALGRFPQDADGELRYSAVERELQQLLTEYGPPRRTTPSYPYHHLVSDGVWEVRTDRGPGSPGSGVRDLRVSGATGRLVPGLRGALSDDPAL